eukprot:jgi/Bigna1/74643/fgenesh1_pg.30_\
MSLRSFGTLGTDRYSGTYCNRRDTRGMRGVLVIRDMNDATALFKRLLNMTNFVVTVLVRTTSRVYLELQVIRLAVYAEKGVPYLRIYPYHGGDLELTELLLIRSKICTPLRDQDNCRVLKERFPPQGRCQSYRSVTALVSAKAMTNNARVTECDISFVLLQARTACHVVSYDKGDRGHPFPKKGCRTSGGRACFARLGNKLPKFPGSLGELSKQRKGFSPLESDSCYFLAQFYLTSAEVVGEAKPSEHSRMIGARTGDGRVDWRGCVGKQASKLLAKEKKSRSNLYTEPDEFQRFGHPIGRKCAPRDRRNWKRKIQCNATHCTCRRAKVGYSGLPCSSGTVGSRQCARCTRRGKRKIQPPKGGRRHAARSQAIAALLFDTSSNTLDCTTAMNSELERIKKKPEIVLRQLRLFIDECPKNIRGNIATEVDKACRKTRHLAWISFHNQNFTSKEDETKLTRKGKQKRRLDLADMEGRGGGCKLGPQSLRPMKYGEKWASKAHNLLRKFMPGTHMKRIFSRMLVNENMLGDDYVVMYHTYCKVAIVYELQSALAGVLLGWKGWSVMPRLVTKPFTSSFASPFELAKAISMRKGPLSLQDHSPAFRDIGICANTYLFHGNEANPANFAYGYCNSPVNTVLEKLMRMANVLDLHDEIFELSERFGFSQIAFLSNDSYSHCSLTTIGNLLQIFVHKDVIDQCAYGSEPMGVLPSERGKISLRGRCFEMGGDTIGQCRLICHPQLFMNPKKIKAFSFSSCPKRHQNRKKLQRALRDLLFNFYRTNREAWEAAMMNLFDPMPEKVKIPPLMDTMTLWKKCNCKSGENLAKKDSVEDKPRDLVSHVIAMETTNTSSPSPRSNVEATIMSVDPDDFEQYGRPLKSRKGTLKGTGRRRRKQILRQCESCTITRNRQRCYRSSEEAKQPYSTAATRRRTHRCSLERLQRPPKGGRRHAARSWICARNYHLM